MVFFGLGFVLIFFLSFFFFLLPVPNMGRHASLSFLCVCVYISCFSCCHFLCPLFICLSTLFFFVFVLFVVETDVMSSPSLFTFLLCL